MEYIPCQFIGSFSSYFLPLNFFQSRLLKSKQSENLNGDDDDDDNDKVDKPTNQHELNKMSIKSDFDDDDDNDDDADKDEIEESVEQNVDIKKGLHFDSNDPQMFCPNPKLDSNNLAAIRVTNCKAII